MTGYTAGTKFPTKDAVQDSLKPGLNCSGAFTRFCFDAFVTKFSPTGQLIYSTYLGGLNDEYTGGLAVDAQGNAYIAGYSWSNDFPVTGGVLQPTAGLGSEFFIAKIGSPGSPVTPTPLPTATLTPTPKPTLTMTPPPPDSLKYKVFVPAVMR